MGIIGFSGYGHMGSVVGTYQVHTVLTEIRDVLPGAMHLIMEQPNSCSGIGRIFRLY